MRKRLIGIAVFSAALTLATGITAFAGTWKEDTHGKYYENDDGSRPVYGNWFTDPETGIVYGMDLDGYVMIDSVMGSYRTDDEGRRVEPTEEELQRAAERKAERASRPSPSKQQDAADLAAAAAKSSTAATTTQRVSYQAEMKTFMDKIFIATGEKRTDKSILSDASEDNTQTTYGFKNPDGYRFITAYLWKTSKETSPNYKEQAFEMSYHFDAASSDADRSIYDDAYNQLVIAALGDTEGKAVLDYVQEQRNESNTSFNREGNTDAGNHYKLTYRNNLVSISIVCSEITPEAEAAAEEEGAETENTETTETTVTTSVIVAGQGSASQDTEAEDTASEDTASDDDTASEDTASETE